ncbi:unnamed protein product [Urochloa humidicola]
MRFLGEHLLSDVHPPHLACQHQQGRGRGWGTRQQSRVRLDRRFLRYVGWGGPEDISAPACKSEWSNCLVTSDYDLHPQQWLEKDVASQNAPVRLTFFRPLLCTFNYSTIMDY